MRHINNPDRAPDIKYNIIQWAFADKQRNNANIEKIIIRNDTCIGGKDFKTSHAMVAYFGEKRKVQVLVFEENQLIDRNGSNKKISGNLLTQ